MTTHHNHSDFHEELNSIAPLLAGLERSMPFRVPEGYFAKAEEGLMETVETGHDIPEGYFEGLPQRLLERIQAKADKGYAGLPVAGNPFRVPEGYLEQLPRQVAHRHKPATKVFHIPLPARLLAAAAIIGLIVSIGIWRPWQQPASGSEVTFADELASYFNRNIHHVDELLLIEAGLDMEDLDFDLYLDLNSNPDLHEDWMLEIDLSTIKDLSL